MNGLRAIEQAIGTVYAEACIASLEAQRGTVGPALDDDFRAVALAIQKAWPDVVKRLRERIK